MKRRTFISLMSVMAAAGVLSLAGCSSNTSASTASSTAASASAAAANKLETIQSNGKLVIALEGAWQPWSFHDESDTLVGYDVEVSRAIAEKLGLELQVDDMGFDAALQAAQTGKSDMVKALKNIRIHPRIHIEEGANGVHFAVNCRHCADPLCVKGCITGALTRQNGMIVIDENKCVGCFTCILSCPYGAIEPDETGRVMQKCELCTKNGAGEPLCVKNCPNQAIVYEER